MTRRLLIFPLLAAMALLGLAGCAAMPAAPAAGLEATMTPTTAPTEPTPEEQATGPNAEPTVPPSATSPETPTPAATERVNAPLPADPALAQVVRVAVADLARRLNLTAESVTLVSVQETEMPVGSLGCPGAEGWENQGIVMGTEIVLAAGDTEYTYRSDRGRLLPCFPEDFPGGHAPIYLSGASLPRATRAVRNVPPKNTIPAAEAATEAIRGRPAVAAALADLAGRLKVADAQIRVVQVEGVQWPDASLGCARRGQMYAQVITPGYRVTLEAGGKTYEYHTSETHAVLCGR